MNIFKRLRQLEMDIRGLFSIWIDLKKRIDKLEKQEMLNHPKPQR